jgi:uncharacterized protein
MGEGMAQPDARAKPGKTILTIDGGGIRGVIPAVLLAAIEERAKEPISKLFDVIAGTSTGGILALGLSCPDASGGPRFKADELVGMYRDQGKTIFPHEFLGFIRQLFEPKYSEEGRRKVLSERFQEARLKETLTEVLITSYDIEGRRPVFFRTALALEKPETHDFAMRDVALATSAAPTYFRPVRLPSGEPGRGDMVLVDGGVFANNPSMVGFVDQTGAQGESEGTLMVSLGTGELTKAIPYKKAKRWGLIGWGPRILDVVFDGVTESVQYEAETVIGDGYRRYQVRLDEDEEAMDNVSRANVDALIDLAEVLVKKRSADLDALCAELLARRTGP